MPKIVDHDLQREQLLDACFELLATEGYAAASMRRLAKAAGVSTGTLYHYFPDKRAILREMFALVTRRDSERVRTAMPADASHDLRARATLAFVRANRSYLTDLLQVTLEARRHDPSPEGRSAVRHAVKEYIAGMTETLDLDEFHTRLLFQFLIGSLIADSLDPGALDQQAEDDWLLELVRSARRDTGE